MRSKGWLVLAVVFSCGSIVAAALSCERAPQSPIVIDNPIVDLGDCLSHASVEAVFDFIEQVEN